MKTKICKECKIEKSVKEYERAYSKNNPSELTRKTCKSCRKSYHTKYKNDNRELLKQKDLNRYWSKSKKERNVHITKKSLQNQHRFKTNKKAAEKRKLYSKSDKGIYTRYKSDSSRRSRNYEFKLSFEDFSKLINSDCVYCGVENCRGIDRIDNSKGYNINNCAPCCKYCNEMKMSKSLTQFKNHIIKIYNNIKLGS